MATRSEAKLALWEASDQDDAARAFIVSFLAEKSQDGPKGGSVAEADIAEAVKAIKPKKQAKKVK